MSFTQEHGGAITPAESLVDLGSSKTACATGLAIRQAKHEPGPPCLDTRELTADLYDGPIE